MSKTTEAQIARVVESVLAKYPNGEASFAQLVIEVPKHLTLSTKDLAPSLTRAGEAVWEQRLRNITSHKNSVGNAIYQGRLVSVPGGLALPPRAVAA